MIVSFTMPFDEILTIRPSKPIDLTDVGSDEEIDGVVYEIFWNDKALPWHTKTKKEAMTIAFGCQFGAYEMIKHRLLGGCNGM